ncbi:MAG: T9SS type A sorting domain-containing protein, partial [Bacteroidota bacterium]
KYFNGDGGDPDGENADFETGGCGVPNGIGGWNRLLDITGRLTDTILPVYEFNSCNSVATATSDAFEFSFDVYPNPFSNTTIVEMQRETQHAYDLRVISVTGQVVMQREGLRSNTLEISRDGLQSGLYFLEIEDSKGRKATRKVIVQ